MDHQREEMYPSTPPRRREVVPSTIEVECNQSIELVMPLPEKRSSNHVRDESISLEDMQLSSKSWDSPQHWNPTQEVGTTKKFDPPLILVTPKPSYEENYIDYNEDNDAKDEDDLMMGNSLRRLYIDMVDDFKRSPAYSVCKDLLVAPSLVPVVHQNVSLQQRDTSDSSLKSPSVHESLLLFSDDLGDDEHRIGHSPLRGKLEFTTNLAKKKPLAFPVDSTNFTQDGQRVVITRSPERKPLQPRPFMVELFDTEDDPFE